MFRFAAERPIREPQVHAPRGAEHRARGFGFRQALLDGAVAAHLAGGQIAQSHPVPQRRMLGNDAAEADLDVVGMRTECEDVYGAVNGHRAHANTSSPFSGRAWSARSRIRADRNAPVTECGGLPRANR